MSVLSYFMRSLVNLFLPPVTVAFPAKPRDYPKASRGGLSIDINACIFCGICVRVCPADALVVDKPARTWSVEERSCVSCNACVVACPKKCLALSPQPPAAFSVATKAGSLKLHQGPAVPPAPAKTEGAADGA